MESKLKQLNIDKSGWALVKFGDIAKEPKENAKDLQAEGIEHVIGLEHIDTEDIHLSRSATLEETTTFTKKFGKGDVLFGRRRAYLKKAAQAPFNGICSGDITVFRANEEILPELLPFVVNNDKFFDYAIKHSAGGLSPRVKFKDLANYEFLLPLKNQQKQLAELLWAMDEVIEREWQLRNKVIDYNNSFIKEQLSGANHLKFKDSKLGKIPIDWGVVNVGEISDITSSKRIFQSDYIDDGIPFYRGKEIIEKSKNIDSKEVKFISPLKFSELSTKFGSPEEGDILITAVGTLGVPYLVKNDDVPFYFKDGNLLWLRKIAKSFNREFLVKYMASNVFQSVLDKITGGSSQKALTIVKLKEAFLHLPPINEQIEIAKKMSHIDSIIKTVDLKIKNSKSLQKSLINQIF
jgi:type I restriction enzyme S subunit